MMNNLPEQFSQASPKLSYSKPKTNLQKLLKLLGDGEWHTTEELSQITWRFGHTIHEARNKGYLIEKRKISHNQFQYRLSVSNDLSKQLFNIIPQVPYLKMLILFGSRGRGEAHENSDWDFAVLYDQDSAEQYLKGWDWFKIYNLLADAFEISSDDIDVVNLDTCSPLIAHHVARDGQLIYEQEAGLFEQFKADKLMTKEELRQLRSKLRKELEVSLARRGI